MVVGYLRNFQRLIIGDGDIPAVIDGRGIDDRITFVFGEPCGDLAFARRECSFRKRYIGALGNDIAPIGTHVMLQFFGACEDAGLRLNAETPEAPKVERPETCQPAEIDGMPVRELEGGFGRYRRSDVHGSIYIDFEYTEGADVMSLTVKQWRSFMVELIHTSQKLGVNL